MKGYNSSVPTAVKGVFTWFGRLAYEVARISEVKKFRESGPVFAE